MKIDAEEVKLWVTTISSLEDIGESHPVGDIPSLKNKLNDVVEGLRDRFGEFLVNEAMAGRLS